MNKIDWNWRKTKKKVRKRIESLQRNGYFIDCRNHPCEITMLKARYQLSGQNLFNAEVEGVSLIDGTETFCSIYHCAPTPLSYKQAMEYKGK